MQAPLRVRATVLSIALFLAFVGIWHVATQFAGGSAVKMDPAYAALMGETAKGASALPGPLDVGAELWKHVTNPFYDKGPNDKGVGIQLAYSIARVMVGFLMAVVVAVPLGFLIGMSAIFTRRSTRSSRC